MSSVEQSLDLSKDGKRDGTSSGTQILSISSIMDRFPLIVPAVYDSIRWLPYGLWIHCIKFAIADSAAGPLHYLMVSSEWNQAIFNSPSLWTTIIIEGGEDEEARIYTFLHLSQDSLLDILYGAAIDTIRTILETNAPRIRSINITEGGSEALLSSIHCYFPALQTFDSFGTTIPRNILINCPNLTIIRSIVDVDVHDLLRSDIQEVTFDSVRAEDITTICQKSKYQTLGLISSLNEMQADNIPGLEDWLKSLDCISTYQSFSLQHLSTRITSSLFSAFFLQVSLLHQLRTLDLQILLEPQGEPTEAVSLKGLGHVHSLKLSFFGMEESESYSKALDIILEALTRDRSLQDLDHISLRSPNISCSYNHLGSCVQSAVNARIIRVDFPSVYGVSDLPASSFVPMNKLEYLTLGPPPILDWINVLHPIVIEWDSVWKPIDLPSRRQFNFQVAEWKDRDHMLEEIDPSLQGELLQNCQAIIFGGECELGSIAKLSMLTDVQLSSVDINRRQMITSGFLDTSLRHPDACPHLQTIRMCVYPYWELLYAVMRQRLAANTSAIKKLVFPVLPCAYLLSHTTRFLRGDSLVFTASDVDVIIFQRHLDPML